MDDEQLLIKLLSNNRKLENEAFEYIYEHYQKKSYSILRSKNASDEEVEEIWQLSIIALHNAAKEKKPINSVEAYLIGIVKKVWYKYLEKKTKVPTSEMNDRDIHNYEQQNLVDEAEKDQRDEIMSIYLHYAKKLPEGCQEFIRLYLLDLSHAEIAKELGIEVDSVKVKKSRCSKKLQEVMKIKQK